MNKREQNKISADMVRTQKEAEDNSGILHALINRFGDYKLKTLLSFAIHENLKHRHGKIFWKIKRLAQIKSKHPKISILIPNKDNAELLRQCVESIIRLTVYKNYEIVIIENNSSDNDIFDYYEQIEKSKKVHVLKYPENGFNFSKIINYGAGNSDGEYILMLNNDMVLLSPDWLDIMLDAAKQEHVGAVSARLVHPDMSVQHLGGTLYIDDDLFICEHTYRDMPRINQQTHAAARYPRSTDWATGGCLMLSRQLFQQIGGMDESFEVEYGDVDLCMKIRKTGKQIVVNPLAELIHYECATRGVNITEEQNVKHKREQLYFYEKWYDVLCGFLP